MNIFLNHQASVIAGYILLVSAMACGNAMAYSTECQDLIQEIETLQNRVHELESAKSVKEPKTYSNKNTGNPWHSLKVNISKAEVTSLLGKPGKIHKWNTGEAWYFPDFKGGEVDFDKNNNVTGWLEP